MADGVAFEAVGEVAGATPLSASVPHAVGLAGLRWSLVTGQRELAELGPHWEALFDRAATSAQMFQSYAWASHWARVYLDAGTRLAVLVGRCDGVVAVIAPFVVARECGVRVLRWLGEPAVQYGDILIAPELCRDDVVAAAWAEITARVRFDVAVLRHVRADAHADSLVRLSGAEITIEETAPFVAAGTFADFSAYEATLAAKRRKNRKRLWNRLRESADVTLETVEAGPRAAALVAEALAQKRAWLKARSMASAAFSDARIDALLANIARGDGPATGLVVFALMADTIPVAVAITFHVKDRLVGYIISYAASHEKAGVGQLNTERMIEGAFQRRAAVFDFLAPGQDYKLDWTDHVVTVRDVLIPVTLRGRLMARVQALRPRLKAQFARLPGWARRLIAGALGGAA